MLSRFWDYTIILFLFILYRCSVVSAAPRGEKDNHDVKTNDYIVPCYFASWAQYKTGGWDYRASDVDPSLCTHIIFSFYKVDKNRLVSLEWNDEAQLTTLVGYKALYPNLKILVAVGGWNAGSVEFSNMVHSSFGRQTFINDCINLMSRLNLDGIDIDWEYPAQRGGIATDKQMYTVLLREMRQAFDAQHRGYLVTVAHSCGEDKIYSSYEIANIAREVDFINLMSYDFHGGWNEMIGIHSNLYGTTPKLDGHWAVEAYILQGAPANKLVLGVVSYGKSFRLCYPHRHTPGDPACGYGTEGAYTREAGTLSYFEICQLTNWNVVYDPQRVGEYRHNGNDWVGYDTVRSIATKCDYIKSRGLLGGFLWELSFDDFRGMCGGGVSPITNALNNCLRGSGPPNTTPVPATTTTTPTTTTTTPTTTTTTPTTTTTTPTTTTTTPTTTTTTPTTTTTTPTTTTRPPTTTTTRTTTTRPPTTTTRPPTTTTTTTRPPTTTTTTTTTTRPTTTTTTPTLKPPTTTTTSPPPGDFQCPTSMGFHDDVTSCKHYWRCSNWQPNHMICMENTMWVQSLLTCAYDWSGTCWGK